MDNFDRVFSEWVNNPEFKEAFTKDPEKAFEMLGLELSPEERALLKKVFAEELDKRINK